MYLSAVLGTMQLSRAHTLAKADAGLELRTIQERVDGITDTRRIIISLVVVGEGSPLGARINNTITQDETTGTTDHVA
jgi:hypothetical protein